VGLPGALIATGDALVAPLGLTSARWQMLGAIVAAMTFLLVHAFYKAALFLSVGMIEKGAGSREYPDLSGLAAAMPLTSSVIALAALSMAGAPPFFGFIGKELIYEAAGHAPVLPMVVAFGGLLFGPAMFGRAVTQPAVLGVVAVGVLFEVVGAWWSQHLIASIRGGVR